MNEQELQVYWKDILNTMNEGLMLIGADGTILLANKALSDLSGYSEEELVGSNCSLFHSEICEHARLEGGAKWCTLFQEGTFNMKRCLILRKDGTWVPVLKNAAVLKAQDGKLLGAVETLTDITEIHKRDQRIEQLSRLLEDTGSFHGLVGRSAAMQHVYEIAERAAQSDAPVIIYGESGVGKELVAEVIHDVGKRRDGPYVALNCAALNESLLESELFGHRKGAFTGAYRHNVGRFEAAHGGDIFLDEIGDLPLSMQVKLLRVLESKEFERVGDHRSISVDVRIIAATNRDLDRLVAQGLFRQDFYFRINVIPIHVPPLRERMEDVPLLVRHFIEKLVERTGKRIHGIASETMDLFMRHSWPGNVRELKSALEYAFVIADEGHVEPRHLPASILGKDMIRQQIVPDTEGEEKKALLEALDKAGGNQTKAAEILGVCRTTVWNRMRKYGIQINKGLN